MYFPESYRYGPLDDSGGSGHAEEAQMTDDTRYVTDESDLTAWRDAVWEGGHRSPVRTHLLLTLASPQMLDRDEWVSTGDAETLADVSDRGFNQVMTHQDAVFQSPYVERVNDADGETDCGNEFVGAHRLVIPEEFANE